MRRKFFLKIAIFICACAGFADAHPFGNFSLNQYARIEIEKSQIKLRAVLDIAEIPAFQESQRIDLNRDGTLSDNELNAYIERITPDYTANLLLSVNGAEPIKLRPAAVSVSLPAGSSGLPTLRVEWDLTGDLPDLEKVNRLRFKNENYAERIGWNEIVVSRASGIGIFDSTAFGSGATGELRAYPQESLSAPLAERSAELSFAAGDLPPNAKVLRNRDGQATTAPVQKDKFAELINVPEITVPIVLFGLVLAFGFGAMHALSPGHGKTVVGAYLVGSRGTIKHAVFLGATVTVTHTLGVFALGLVTLFASDYILPERLMPLLNFSSGSLVLFIGLALFKNRLFSVLGWNKDLSKHGYLQEAGHFYNHEHFEDEHALGDGATHTHGGSTHTHLSPKDVSWRGLLGLGIAGGLLPCPSALVLMLSAISIGRVGYGLVLTLVFSFGLAATLTGVGLAFLYVGKFFDSHAFTENRIIRTLPVFSAFVIACVGAAICYESLK